MGNAYVVHSAGNLVELETRLSLPKLIIPSPSHFRPNRLDHLLPSEYKKLAESKMFYTTGTFRGADYGIRKDFLDEGLDGTEDFSLIANPKDIRTLQARAQGKFVPVTPDSIDRIVEDLKRKRTIAAKNASRLFLEGHEFRTLY